MLLLVLQAKNLLPKQLFCIQTKMYRSYRKNDHKYKPKKKNEYIIYKNDHKWSLARLNNVHGELLYYTWCRRPQMLSF